MRSSNSTPLPRYFLAIEITSLKFDSMSRARASSSPSRERVLSSRSSAALSNRPPRIFPRYCVRVSCSIPSPFSATSYAAGCDPPLTRDPPCTTNRCKTNSSRLLFTCQFRPHEHLSSGSRRSFALTTASLNERRQHAGSPSTYVSASGSPTGASVVSGLKLSLHPTTRPPSAPHRLHARSEERRVGKECRS